MNIRLLALAATTATALAAGSANAAIVFTFIPGGASPAGGFTVVDTFDTADGLTGSNFQIKVPPADGNGAPPANSDPSGTAYLSVLGGGSATYTFAGDVSAFEFDWGSVDSYNTLTINSTGADPIIVPGLSFPNAANGNQVDAGTNGLFRVVGNDGERFNSVTFSSGSNSFEVDNLATNVVARTTGGVPEPASWALMIVGFGGAGAALRGQRRRQAVACA
jgi:hypothetical protein